MPEKTSALADSYWRTVAPETAWIHRQVRRLGVRDADLDDATQEVLVDLYRKWESFETGRSLRAWVFGFVVNVVGNYLRRPHIRREDLTDELEAPDGRPGADEQIASAESRALVVEALHSVDFERRSVFVMSEIEELPMSEIATTLAIPVNTAYSRLRLARREFAAAVHRIKLRRGEP